jgi:septum formation protein
MLGLSFEVIPSNAVEVVRVGDSPAAHAERLAREKVEEVRKLRPEALVLAGDTIVVLDEEILGKPDGPEEAVEMLLRLAGKTHKVVSALALGIPGRGLVSGVEETEVEFRSFGPDLARRYVGTKEPLDKAGAYGIQGRGSALVRRLRGDYFTVVGLPVPLLLRLLEGAGWMYAFGELVPSASAHPG